MTGHAKSVAIDAVQGNVFTVLAHNRHVLVIQTHAGMDLDEGYLDEGRLKHAATTYGAFNLGLHVGDDPKTVLQHRGQLLGLINDYLRTHPLPAEQGLMQTLHTLQTRAIATPESLNTQDTVAASKVRIDSIYWLNQVHGNEVVTISDTLVKKPLITLMPSIPAPQITVPALLAPDADAIITPLARTAVAIMTADCVPIVMYGANAQNVQQPVAQIAAIHAGWKGLANGVIAKTYDALMLHLNRQLLSVQINSDPVATKSQAWIGTSIGPACYEVSLAVVAQLLEGCQQLGMATAVIRQQVVTSHDDPNKAWLDLPLLAKLQLEALGVEVISGTPPCSYSDSQYYSYRRMTHRQQRNTGRMALLIMRLDE